MDNYKICGCFSRKFKKEDLNPPLDIIESFKIYAESGAHMVPEQLHKFMVEVQGETTATVADAEKIVEAIMRLKHPHISIFSTIIRKSLSFDDFFFYLFSVELNSPIKSQVYLEMTNPLSHYFIYTGHNSYLTGNQLSSDCSDVPIIQALQRGVRVIELDLWPTPSKEDVHVLHGKTLTTPVELIKCVKAIKDYAFSASPYPVILTLEDHLNPKLQAIVAQMITRELGDMLFYPQKEISKDFPSPEELKYKVIISTKPPKEYISAEIPVDEGKESQKEQPSSEEQTSIDNEINDDKDNVDANVYEDEYNSEYDAMHEEPPAYKNLITIPGIKRGKLKESLKVDTNNLSRLSWSEQTLAKAITTSYGTDIVRYTQKNILRIYPKVTRVDSSNYEPLVGWIHGAQMVAFNMQGYGKPLWLMQGLFRANGGCGYVKKPDFLLNLSSDNQVFDPKADLPFKTTLKVKVYMGDGWDVDFKQTHFDFYSPPDFYVGIAGAPKDEVMKKTKVIENRWIPAWDEDFSFPLTIPELALLRVEVHEHDTSEKDDFAGQTCLPVSELKPGFHAVPLYNFEGDKYSSVKLLMKFEGIHNKHWIILTLKKEKSQTPWNTFGEEEANATETAKKAVAKALRRSRTFSSKKGLKLNDFLHFLLGELNPPLYQQEDNLQLTLPHYFVYTSHHSYLKQQKNIQVPNIIPIPIPIPTSSESLISMHTMSHRKSDEELYKIPSSISAIVKTLNRGVRVIELNLFPSIDNKNVEVHHDRTLHSKVTLSKCLDAIKENAFKTSDFPVIIILVEHISPNLRAVVAAEKPSDDYKKLIAGHIEDLEDGVMNLEDGDASTVRILSTTEGVLENAGAEDIIRSGFLVVVHLDLDCSAHKNLLAVYPNQCPEDGKIVSSNYDPFIGWTRGAQMVAFHTQMSDKYLWIMQGLFRAYGDTGYVRKPDILLNKQQKFNPTLWRPVKKILKVKVFMGTGWHLDFGSKEFDKESPPDFFAALEIVGVPADEAREKTSPEMDQWIPTWNQEFEFALTVPEIAMLMIEVREFDTDRTHDFGGQTCLPVWLIRNGI
ncbi:hypothetical protein KSS87_012725, partial [Heliosperma pusillum]